MKYNPLGMIGIGLISIILIIASVRELNKIRNRIPFDTEYEVCYINAAGQRMTDTFYLPSGINAIEVQPDRGGYSMVVLYDNLNKSEHIKAAVIDVRSFKKLSK